MKHPNKILKPVIKWSGSKRAVAIDLSKLFVEKERYIEPFLGGGSMLPFRKTKSGIAADIIPELINLWNEIKEDPHNVYLEYENRWARLQNEGHDVYYEIRDRFNRTKNPFDFLFLTRTCVNGLIRYNSNGEFNNSMHKNRPGIQPSSLRNILIDWSFYIKDISFVTQDYKQSFDEAKKSDFIFLDPPYGGNKGRYKKIGFDVEEFYRQLEILNSKGVQWILTFDGSAGERIYNFELPKEIYKHKLEVKTGNSPFTKLMKTGIDPISESVYTNYEISESVIGDFYGNKRQMVLL